MPLPAKKEKGIFEKVPGSGVWWIRYADGNSRIHRECVGMKSTARVLYGKRKTEIREGRFFPKEKKRIITFEELVDDALQYSLANSCSMHHRTNQRRAIVVKGWFKGRSAAEVTPQAINGRLQELADSGLKPATVNQWRAFLSLVFKVGVANEKIGTNPVRKVPQRKVANTRLRFFSPAEEFSVKKAALELFPESAPELIAEITLAINSGLRRDELWHLEWRDVDIGQRLICLLNTKNGDTRYVPINSAAMAAFRHLRQATTGEKYVIPGSQNHGRGIDSRRFKELFEKAGLSDCCYHTFRHTCCSRLVMKGVPIPSVQEIMGHRDIQTTLRYCHLSPHFQHRAIELIAGESKWEASDFFTDTKTDTRDNFGDFEIGGENGQVH
jgi:integrase